MSQRVAKVESLIQQVVATALVDLLEGDAARVTVTRVDAAPDIRNATVWIGLITNGIDGEALWERLESVRGDIQTAVGTKMTTKFVPRIHLKRDTGGEYAAEIDRLLRKN
jgi:ribosome-binding factor A